MEPSCRFGYNDSCCRVSISISLDEDQLVDNAKLRESEEVNAWFEKYENIHEHFRGGIEDAKKL